MAGGKAGVAGSSVVKAKGATGGSEGEASLLVANRWGIAEPEGRVVGAGRERRGRRGG